MSSRALTPKDVTWIVKIMYEDSELVQKREVLCLALGISMSQLTDITRCKLADTDTRVFLTQILDVWISNSSEPTFEKLIEVLRNEKFILTADEIVKKHLEHLPPLSAHDFEEHSQISSPSIWFGVPDDVHVFTGRVEYMKELHESLIRQNSIDAINDMTVITAVSGMGGIGKTSLTVHYAWSFVNKFYVNVVWINSESVNTITNSFKRLARELGQNTSLELCEVIQGVYKYFGNSKTLIVFDNVESYEDIKSYLPNRSPNILRPYVLLSSRKRDWHLRTYLIDLDLFSVAESVEFFKVYLNLKSEQELDFAEKISSELQNLPLAIRQAGAYIKLQRRDRSTSLVEEMKSYLETFHANFMSILKFEHWAHTADIYEKTVYSALTLNMSKLRKQNYLTKTIMEFISYLNPDNIPVKLLYNIQIRGLWKRITNPTIEQSEVDSAVKLLTDFSLITKQTDRLDTICVHRLLQKVVRDQVQSKYIGSQFNWIISCIRRPLKLNNFDHYEDLSLIHSLTVKQHIPASLLEKKYVKSFIELTAAKQSNSIDLRLELLKDMLRREDYEEMLETYEKSRSIYITKEAGVSNNTNALLQIRLVNLIFLEILRDYQLSGSCETILKRCQIIRDVVDGFHISYDNEFILDIENFLCTAEQLHAITILGDNVSLTTERKTVISTLYRMLNIIIEYFKNYKGSMTLWYTLKMMKMMKTIINLLTDFGKSKVILEVIHFVIDFIEPSLTGIVSDIYDLGACIYNSSHHENMIHVREELLLKSLHFYEKYINNTHLLICYYISHKPGKINEGFIIPLLVSQSAMGIINCLLELNRSSEIIESLSQVTAIFSEYDLLQLDPIINEKYELDIVGDLLFSTGMHPASANVKNELIQHSFYLFNRQYELEKSHSNITDALITIRKMIEKYLELGRLNDIITLSDEFQQTIRLRGATAVSIMPRLCEILLKSGRDSKYKIKHPPLITQCLKISKECMQAVKDDVYKLTFRYYTATCEFLLEPNLDIFIQHSEYIFRIVLKYGDRVNLDYLKVLAKVAIELRQVGQYDIALVCFDHLRKIYFARGDLLLFESAGWTNDLNGVIRDDVCFERAMSVLPGVMLEDLS